MIYSFRKREREREHKRLTEGRCSEALEFERAELQQQAIEHNRQQEELRRQTLERERAELICQAHNHERQSAIEAERLKAQLIQIEGLAENRREYDEFQAREVYTRLSHENEEDKIRHRTLMHKEHERINQLHENLLTIKSDR